MTFKTSLDNLAKGVTTGVTLLFAIIIITQFSVAGNGERTIPIFKTVFLLFLYFIPFVLRPINYKLLNGQLIIHRLFSDIKIDRNQIKSVEYLDRSELGWVFRTFGVGGFFGYFGKFTNTKIGSMTWYATRRDKTVLVTTINNKKIILTPDEPDQFVSTFDL